MKSQTRNLLSIAVMIAAIGGLEYYFFLAPDLLTRPAQAATQRPEVKPVALATAQELAPEGQVADPVKESRHIKNVKQLTFGGENAEAYWSFDSKKITLQSTRGDLK